VLVIQNKAPVALTDIQVTPVLIDTSGRVLQQGAPVRVMRPLKSGEQIAANAGLSNLTQEQLPYLRFRVDQARVAD
jgi:beta-barrel assembly-enhancing protease